MQDISRLQFDIRSSVGQSEISHRSRLADRVGKPESNMRFIRYIRFS